MTNILRSSLALATLGAAMIDGGCTVLPRVDAKGEAQTIRGLDAQFGDAAARKDLPGYVAAYAPDAVMMSDTSEIRGITGIRTNAKAFLTAPGLALKVVPEKIDIATGGDLALDTGHLEVGVDTLQGRMKITAHYFHVWQKLNGRWLLIFEIVGTRGPAVAM